MAEKKLSTPLMISGLLIILGLGALVTGIGLKFHANMKDTVDFAQLFLCMLAAVAIAFLYGAVRFSLGAGIALGIAALHDQMLTLALVSLVSIVLPQSQNMPILVVLAVAFTFCQSLPVLRACMDLRASTPLREMDNAAVASQAIADTCQLRKHSIVLAMLLFLAGAVSGLGLLAGFLVPAVLALAASVLAARFLTPALWSHTMARWGMKKSTR